MIPGDYSWMGGVEIKISFHGDEPGCFWIGAAYWRPTYTERKLCGLPSENDMYFVEMRPENEVSELRPHLEG